MSAESGMCITFVSTMTATTVWEKNQKYSKRHRVCVRQMKSWQKEQRQRQLGYARLRGMLSLFLSRLFGTKLNIPYSITTINIRVFNFILTWNDYMLDKRCTWAHLGQTCTETVWWSLLVIVLVASPHILRVITWRKSHFLNVLTFQRLQYNII